MPPRGGPHPVAVGGTTGRRHHLLRYSMKPASASTNAPGTLRVRNQRAELRMQSTSSHGEVRLVGGVEEKRDEFALICEGGRYRLERLESVVTGLKPGSPRAAPARSPRAAAPPARSPSGDDAVDESMLFGDDDDEEEAPVPASEASSSRTASTASAASAGGIQLQTHGGADDSESESLSDSA